MRSQSNGTDTSTLYSLIIYREVPQDSTHFAPFELMYGRTHIHFTGINSIMDPRN